MLTTLWKGRDEKHRLRSEPHTIEADDQLVAAASCTTNAIVPVLKAINDRFGIVHGHMETVHAYTDDQNLHDNTLKERRGRSAPLNMVLTESNGELRGKLLPELAGKLTGNSIRLPVPNVSMAILNLTVEETTTREESATFANCSLNSAMQDRLITPSPAK